MFVGGDENGGCSGRVRDALLLDLFGLYSEAEDGRRMQGDSVQRRYKIKALEGTSASKVLARPAVAAKIVGRRYWERAGPSVFEPLLQLAGPPHARIMSILPRADI